MLNNYRNKLLQVNKSKQQKRLRSKNQTEFSFLKHNTIVIKQITN